MAEQKRSSKERLYQKVKRAEDEQRTRARIVDAAERLHAELGPATTTVSAVAHLAGVTRATVYRHFPDNESLFLACSGQWLSRQTLPDPDAWEAHADPFDRLRAGLTDIYRYYRQGEPMLTAVVLREAAAVPARIREGRLATEKEWHQRLVCGLPGRRRKAVRAAVAHAMSFGTWRSLCIDLGLSDPSAVHLMAAMITAAASDRPPHR